MPALRSLKTTTVNATTAAIARLEAELEVTLAACRPKQRPPLEEIRQRLTEIKTRNLRLRPT
jgi:hypothetical protein